MLDLSMLGFVEPPFSLSPDPRYFYMSLQHKATLAKATYAIEQRQGISVIFGDVGAGKTTIARRLFQIYRDRPEFETAYIPTPLYPSEFQFLKGISAEFGIPPKRSKLTQLANCGSSALWPLDLPPAQPSSRFPWTTPAP